jgi:hypothetical protein
MHRVDNRPRYAGLWHPAAPTTGGVIERACAMDAMRDPRFAGDADYRAACIDAAYSIDATQCIPNGCDGAHAWGFR